MTETQLHEVPYSSPEAETRLGGVIDAARHDVRAGRGSNPPKFPAAATLVYWLAWSDETLRGQIEAAHAAIPDDTSPRRKGEADERTIAERAAMMIATMTEAAVEAGRMREQLRSLQEQINTPELHDFVAGVLLEAAHQRQRWPSAHDAGKTDADWFWLIGYLAGKALHNPPNDMSPEDARLHRIVATAAAAANWHAAKLGLTDMRPGIDIPMEGAAG